MDLYLQKKKRSLRLEAKHLPHFAGDPPWDPAAMCSLLRQSLTPQHGFRAAAPTWDRFLKALGRPKRKAAGPDGVAPHLLGWLPLALQWELYLCIVSAWNTGTMPKQWSTSRVTLLYKKGSPTSALNYRPISVSGCMYTLFASLLLQAMERPLNQASSPEQAGARKGHTTSAQALNLWSTLLQSDNPSYVCLLDVAKAFPSTPHGAILQALHCIGAPAHLLQLVEQIYQQPMNECGGLTYRVHRGIKEGCPLSPALFTLAYQSFHGTLQRGFPDVDFFIDVDDIAFIARSESELQAVLHRVQELSQLLGFKINHSKTEVIHWAPRYRKHQVHWAGHTITASPPLFKCLGHLIAHPTMLQSARADIQHTVQCDLARYRTLPLDAFERTQLLSSVLMPRWVYRSLFVASDHLLHDIDMMAREFVTTAKGVERRHHLLHLTDPVCQGGTGLHQMYRAFRCRYITLLQTALRDRPGSGNCPAPRRSEDGAHS